MCDNDIEAAIRVRKNSSSLSGRDRAHGQRNGVVLKQLKKYKRWKHGINYGYGWMAERFSVVLRGGLVNMYPARKYPYMVMEILLKASLY